MNNSQEHEYVDLGLPSGTLWATCNLGASKPEDFGNYYAWGEIAPKGIYNWDTYVHSSGGDYDFFGYYYPFLTKYCNISDYGHCHNGFIDDMTILQSNDDPATTNWGSDWHTPTNTQWEELMDNSSIKWMTKNGVMGISLTSKINGQTMFLPAAGFRRNDELSCVGSNGNYWSSSLDTSWPSGALYFYFSPVLFDVIADVCRSYGHSVRPVRIAR